MPIFCFKSLFSCTRIPPKKKEWNVLPDDIQVRVVELLEPMEKARLSLTSRSNYRLVKRVPTAVHCLQFAPIREIKKSLKIFVFFDETHFFVIEFVRNGNGCILKVEKDGKMITTRILETGYQEMADACLEGWMKGTTIATLDIRGHYTGQLPAPLSLTTFSFADKYRSEHSAIPNWLNRIGSPKNLMLMSDHWNTILPHRLLINPSSTCRLTGYDEMELTGHVDTLRSRQMTLNNVKDEKTFNEIAIRWSKGWLHASFEWLIVTSVSRALKRELLLKYLRVHSLDKEIFKDFEKLESETEPVEYFLVSSYSGQFAIFCGMRTYARLLALSQDILKQLPGLQEKLKSVQRY